MIRDRNFLSSEESSLGLLILASSTKCNVLYITVAVEFVSMSNFKVKFCKLHELTVIN